MKSSRETYGTEVSGLTKEQEKNRMELFEEADILAAGAAAHGKVLSIPEALERAHIIKSQGTRDEVIRQDIRDSIEKRTKTTRGSHQKASTTDTDQSITEEELERRTEARLQSLRSK